MQSGPNLRSLAEDLIYITGIQLDPRIVHKVLSRYVPPEQAAFAKRAQGDASTSVDTMLGDCRKQMDLLGDLFDELQIRMRGDERVQRSAINWLSSIEKRTKALNQTAQQYAETIKRQLMAEV